MWRVAFVEKKNGSARVAGVPVNLGMHKNDVNGQRLTRIVFGMLPAAHVSRRLRCEARA